MRFSVFALAVAIQAGLAWSIPGRGQTIAADSLVRRNEGCNASDDTPSHVIMTIIVSPNASKSAVYNTAMEDLQGNVQEYHPAQCWYGGTVVAKQKMSNETPIF
ncbi:hypothetical protein BX600DRAFT_432756 [Xylariales sp. PMI_506]|nr:hypothetical protein BX600DRAFT_432756 [Xylariales sp. PMI_506]